MDCLLNRSILLYDNLDVKKLLRWNRKWSKNIYHRKRYRFNVQVLNIFYLLVPTRIIVIVIITIIIIIIPIIFGPQTSLLSFITRSTSAKASSNLLTYFLIYPTKTHTHTPIYVYTFCCKFFQSFFFLSFLFVTLLSKTSSDPECQWKPIHLIRSK